MSSKKKTTVNNEKAKPELVPTLRFPEFQGAAEWEPKRLGSVGQLTRGLTYSSDDVSPAGLLVLRSTNIQNGSLLLDKDLVFVGKPCPEALRLQAGDIVVCMSNGSKALVGKSGEYSGKYEGAITVGAFCSFFRPEFPFAKIAFHLSSYQSYIADLIAGGNINNLTNSVLEEFRFSVPSLTTEQQKIAECLSSVDELMAAQARKVDALKTHKKGLMQQLFPREGETQPRLRFPEFQNTGEWEESTVEELIVTVTPPKKLQTSDYQPVGEFPIVDQSQDYICGWTNDGEAVIDKGLPVIVFGDHTCALKFVDQPFAQGADGIKILRPKRGIDIRFLYCALEADPVAQESYKRHFSILKEKKLFYPDPKSGEQHSIGSCLSSLDTLITAETRKLEALKTHKKGLMQQLFPSLEEK